jgi:hypothetical protein
MNNNYGTKSGTSMSAPIVSGVVALMLGEYGSFFDLDLLKFVLPAITDDLGTIGYDQFFGHGIINATKALSLSFPPKIELFTFTEPQILDNQAFLNYSVNEHFDNQVNITLDLLTNGSYIQNLQSLVNQIPRNFSYLLDPSLYIEGFNYSIHINASTTLFSTVEATESFTIDYVKNPITNVTLLSPLPSSVYNDSLDIIWQVDDVDGPPHQTEITLHWDTDQSKSFGVTQEYSKTFFIYDLSNRSDYWLELQVSDHFSNYVFNSSVFTINNPAHRPEIEILYPSISNTTVFTGNVSISWRQSDLNGDFLNTSLYIRQNVTLWLVAANLTESENIVIWDSFTVPDGGNYQLDIHIRDGIYSIHYLSAKFFIDNPHIPEVNLLSPSDPAPVSLGLIHITWQITDLDGENISGVLEYRLLSDPFTWIFLDNVTNQGTFLWDTGQLIIPDESISQIRLNISDGIYQLVYYSQFITLINPIEPDIDFQTFNSPLNATHEEKGIISFRWTSSDTNGDYEEWLYHSFWLYNYTDAKWSKLSTIQEYVGNCIGDECWINKEWVTDYIGEFDWNSTESAGHTYLVRMFTYDGYYNLSNDWGIFSIQPALPPEVSVEFQIEEYITYSLPIRFTVTDPDSNDFTVKTFVQYCCFPGILYGPAPWEWWSDVAVHVPLDAEYSSFFVNFSSQNSYYDISLKVVISDGAFVYEFVSERFSMNYNTAPRLLKLGTNPLFDVPYPIVTHETDTFIFNILDREKHPVLVEFYLMPRSAYLDPILMQTNIVTRSSIGVGFLSYDWGTGLWANYYASGIGGNYTLQIHLTDMPPEDSRLEQSLAKKTQIDTQIELAIPKISFFPSDHPSRLEMMEIRFRIEDPREILDDTFSFVVYENRSETTVFSKELSIKDTDMSSIVGYDFTVKGTIFSEYYLLDRSLGVYMFTFLFTGLVRDYLRTKDITIIYHIRCSCSFSHNISYNGEKKTILKTIY